MPNMKYEEFSEKIRYYNYLFSNDVRSIYQNIKDLPFLIKYSWQMMQEI